MKTCPTCKARCFDDMEVCYGCMHRFEDEGAADPPYASGEHTKVSPPLEDVALPLEGRELEPGQVPARVVKRAPARRRSPLKSAYVFGASGNPANPAHDAPDLRNTLDESDTVDSQQHAGKETASHARGIALTGNMALPLRDIDADAVSQLMSSAVRNGRRLIICIE